MASRQLERNEVMVLLGFFPGVVGKDFSAIRLLSVLHPPCALIAVLHDGCCSLNKLSLRM